MTLYPEVQRKAQFELDTVIGLDRLPTHADRERLAYVNALVLEVLRWHPVVPLGVPHRLLQDDVYEGHRLPRGTIVIANIWCVMLIRLFIDICTLPSTLGDRHMTHDDKTYSKPMAFTPERYLHFDDHEPEKDPRDVVFGFGRRSVLCR